MPQKTLDPTPAYSKFLSVGDETNKLLPPLPNKREPAIPFDEQDEILGTYDNESISRKFRALNRAQRNVFLNLLDGMSQKEACAKAGLKSTSTIKSIEKKIPDLMKRVGLTDKYLAEKLKSVIEAKETKFFQTSADVTRVDPLSGEITETKEIIIEEREIINLSVRHAGLDMAHKLLGDYAKPGDDPASQTFNVNIVHVGAQ